MVGGCTLSAQPACANCCPKTEKMLPKLLCQNCCTNCHAQTAVWKLPCPKCCTNCCAKSAVPKVPCPDCHAQPLFAAGQVTRTPQSHLKLSAKDQEFDPRPLEWLQRGSFSALGFLVFHCSLSAYTVSQFHTSSVS